MAKTKPASKSIPKAKPAKVAKKDNKKPVKKPAPAAKKAAPVKTQKVVAKPILKKAEAKKEKEVKKAAVPAAKVNAKTNEKAPVAKAANTSATKPISPSAKAAKPEAKPSKQDAKAPKPDSKAKSKLKKPEKKAEEDFDDDVIGDDFGDSEIAEYEEDLKTIEDDEDDTTLELTDDDDTEEKDEEIYLTDSEGRRLCRVRDCDQVSNVEGYCRYHYLLLWKKIQVRKHILLDGKLEKYIEDLMSRYPDKFLDVIKKDLKTEKDFISVIQEMELDESALAENDGEDEVQSFADEIRGIGEAPSMDEDGDY